MTTPNLGDKRTRFAWLPVRVWRLTVRGFVEHSRFIWLAPVTELYIGGSWSTAPSGWIAHECYQHDPR